MNAVQGMSDHEFDYAVSSGNKILKQLKDRGMSVGAHVVIDAGQPGEKEVEIRSLGTEFYWLGRTRRYKVVVSYWIVTWDKANNSGRNNRSNARVFLERGTLP